MFGSDDPDNPLGGLLGDLLKVIGSGPGAGDNWFEAARTLAFGVATDGGQDENPDPLVRIAFEELARVAELHVTEALGIAPRAGSGGISFEAVGPGQWSFRLLEAYRPVLKAMVEAQQQGAAAVPTTLDLSELGPDASTGLSGLLSQFALTLGPVFLGMQFGSAAGHLARRAFGQYALPLPSRVLDAPAGPRERGPLRRRLEPPAPGGPALGLRARAGHARGAHPARCALLAHHAAR